VSFFVRVQFLDRYRSYFFANWKRTFGQNKARFGLFLLNVIEAHCGPKENGCISEKVVLKCIIIATEVLIGFCCKVLKYEEFNHFIFLCDLRIIEQWVIQEEILLP